MSDPQAVVAHYGTGDLTGKVAEALRRAGLDQATLTWQALAPLDQFHAGGAAATTELATRIVLRPGMRVLDVGCGFGGPARHLAAVHGVEVTGIDLNPEYIALARMLTERTGLSAMVRHLHADALALPFELATFEVAWTQHVAMNIADRPALYRGIRWVLVPGGQLAIYDVIAAGSDPLHFPVPWARDASISFVVTADAMRQALGVAGFEVVSWVDMTDAGIASFAQEADRRARGVIPPPFALPIVMGPDFPGMVANFARNLAEGRARLVQAVMRSPG